MKKCPSLYALIAVVLVLSAVILVKLNVFTGENANQSETAVLIAKATKPATSFFEKAWKTNSSSNNYQFTCTVSSGDVKAPTSNLTPDQQKTMSLVSLALSKYKSRINGILQGNANRLFFVQDKINTLKILDSITAGVTVDKAIQAVKSAVSQSVTIMTFGKNLYYKTTGDLKTFEDSKTASQIYNNLSTEPITASIDKASLKFKNFISVGPAQTALYEGKFTQSSTASLLTPFISQAEAKKQPAAPVKVYFDNATGQMQKYDMSDRVKLGGLEFTVNESCTFDFKNTQVNIPAKVNKVNNSTGTSEFAKILQSM